MLFEKIKITHKQPGLKYDLKGRLPLAATGCKASRFPLPPLAGTPRNALDVRQ
jgi:hypothetical protein